MDTLQLCYRLGQYIIFLVGCQYITTRNCKFCNYILKKQWKIDRLCQNLQYPVLKSCQKVSKLYIYEFLYFNMKHFLEFLKHNFDYVVFLYPQQSKILYLHTMNFSCFHCINPRGIYTGMT